MLHKNYDGYNNWTNYETWAIASAIDNNETLFNIWADAAANAPDVNNLKNQMQEFYSWVALPFDFGQINFFEIASALYEEHHG